MGVTKTKVTKADIVVKGTEERPYYVIVYHELGKEYDNEGFGSYSLENVLEWRNECLELIEEEKEMAVEMAASTEVLVCNVCGASFKPLANRRYTARDNIVTGAAAALAHREEALFDAFDCPVCGCQVIAQERKRSEVEMACDCCEGEENLDGAG